MTSTTGVWRRRLNPSGLLLLGNSRVAFSAGTNHSFDYIPGSVKIISGFPGQDTGKGYLLTKAVVDKWTELTLMTTHMPVKSSKYTDAIGKCFQNLASAVPPGRSPVLLMGDFNLDETSDEPVHGVRRFSN